MRGRFREFNVQRVWHFTDRSNIEYIEEQGGLLSLYELNRRGVRGFRPGGNQWSHDADCYKGVNKYVHLAFIKDHPMQFRAIEDGRIENPIWLEIDAEVALRGGVRFTSDVSNKAGVPLLEPEAARDEIDFEALFSYLDWSNPELRKRRQDAVKSEVLVPDFIEIKDILRVHDG